MKTVINVKADKDVKEKAQKIAKELGVSLSTIINAQLKDFIRSRSVYLSTLPRISPALEAFLGHVEEDIRNKKNFSRPLHSAREIAGYIDRL